MPPKRQKPHKELLGFGKISEARLLATIHQEAFDNAYSIEQMRESLKQPHNYVIKHGDIGFVLFQLFEDECEIITIAVLPKFQDKGFAREMIIELLGICRQMQVKKVFLEVSTKNTAAIHLYKKFTFVEYNRRSKYYADGSDAILLQLML
jgi:ribosomal-protein-alanine N-acetyltransferase